MELDEITDRDARIQLCVFMLHAIGKDPVSTCGSYDKDEIERVVSAWRDRLTDLLAEASFA